MRLLKEQPGTPPTLLQFDLDPNYLSESEAQQQINNFQPEVIFALSDDENEYVLKFATKNFCHMGLYFPRKTQLAELQLKQAYGLAKLFFLKPSSPDIDYFQKFGSVIHQNYLEQCNKLVYFLCAIDADAFE